MEIGFRRRVLGSFLSVEASGTLGTDRAYVMIFRPLQNCEGSVAILRRRDV